MFSFGVILNEVYSRKDPYEDDEDEFDDIIDDIVDPVMNKRPAVPDCCPDGIIQMMTKCLSPEPLARPTFEELDIDLKAMNVQSVERRIVAGSGGGGGSAGRGKKGGRRASQSEALLEEVFPSHIAKALHAGEKVEPESKDVVTIFFSDIVGFTNISTVLTPMKVSDLLDRLYLKFDELSLTHGVRFHVCLHRHRRCRGTINYCSTYSLPLYFLGGHRRFSRSKRSVIRGWE